jgi:NTP pyrophosphatase (non-canonical NTP hydrolase)
MPGELTLNEYQKLAYKTAIYPQQQGLAYCALGLNGEAGEVAEQIKKAIRDDGGRMTSARLEALDKEIGDVLWYLSELATQVNLSLGGIARRNLEKLRSRKARGVLTGSGDDR